MPPKKTKPRTKKKRNPKNKTRKYTRQKPTKKIARRTGDCKKKPKPGRSGPADSATCHPIGTVKRGGKGGLWVVKAIGNSQRWVKL
jgi:hypothetical protein